MDSRHELLGKPNILQALDRLVPLIYSSSFKHVKPHRASYLGYFPGKIIKVLLVRDVKNTHENLGELGRLILSLIHI